MKTINSDEFIYFFQQRIYRILLNNDNNSATSNVTKHLCLDDKKIVESKLKALILTIVSSKSSLVSLKLLLSSQNT